MELTAANDSGKVSVHPEHLVSVVTPKKGIPVGAFLFVTNSAEAIQVRENPLQVREEWKRAMKVEL